MLRNYIVTAFFFQFLLSSHAQFRLGEVACVYVTTSNLDSSVAFYEKLGFPKTMSNDFPFPWAQVSDGSLMIMMRKDTVKYTGLTYYISDIEQVAAQLEKRGIQFTQKPKDDDVIKRYYFKSPDGLNIMLASNLGSFAQPTGITLLNMGHEDLKSEDKYPNKQCGAFGEFSHPVTDLNKSIEFWTKIGFEVKSQMTSPYPWAILSDGLMLIGLHQTKDFSFPAVTYFGLNTEQRVQQLKDIGVSNVREVMGKSNVSVTTWEGLHFFLFSTSL